MGKVTWHGWSSSSAEIPQPTSILYGANLKKSSKESSNQPPAPKQEKPKAAQ